MLRTSISAQDPQQQTIDGLEKSIAELMSKLMDRALSPSGKKGRRHVRMCLHYSLLGSILQYRRSGNFHR